MAGCGRRGFGSKLTLLSPFCSRPIVDTSDERVCRPPFTPFSPAHVFRSVTASLPLLQASGLEAIAQAMDMHADSAMAQAAALLCLVPSRSARLSFLSLILSSPPPLTHPSVVASPRRHLQACGVEAIAQAMDLHADSVMVQAAAMLCLIPLTLDNAMMQVGTGLTGSKPGLLHRTVIPGLQKRLWGAS